MTAPTPADVPGQGEVEGLAVAISAADETVDLRYGLHVADAILASDWLAERDAEVARRAWDAGYLKADEDYERHLNHAPLYDCDCPEDALAANPYRATEPRA